MTVHRSPNASICVVVEPGSAPYPTPWPLELHGPLDAVALEKILGELTAGDPGRTAVRYRLLRHGPDHHTLRLSATRGASGARVSGCVADLLTEPPVARRPLTAAQYAARAPEGEQRYEAVVIEPEAPLEAGVLREALRAVVAAHPQLRSRLDGNGGWLTGAAASGDAGPDPLVEGEFTDEASFAKALARTGRTLDARTGVQLRALLARDRRPGGPRGDRLALVVHELAVDAASWRILLDDLTAALGAAAAGAPARPRRVPDGLADWVAELRELARDTDEGRHWGGVAARRAQAAGSRQTAPGAVRRSAFVLAEGATERITRGLARRLVLTAGQVLTGVFALALARWYGCDEVDFDVWGDPRPGRQGLRRQVGRLTDPYPVHLAPGPGPDPLDQLDALAGALAACAGRAAGGAGFGACREWSPDPLLRHALGELPPAQACLILHGAGEPQPARADTADGGAPTRPGHPLEVQARVVGGRLHIGLDWVADARLGGDGLTDARVRDLERLLRDLLEELAELPAAPAGAVFRPTAQQAALYTGGDADPGTGRHVEQLVWVWHGPLDAARFAAAWQSVFDCETVLRTAFSGTGEPLLVLHERVVPEITRQVSGDGGWSPFLERDRLRGFDLRRPGALRLTLLETEAAASAGRVAPTRILLTYHRALLDNWSAHLLLREFYRAYLTGGTLPGGERRPDLRDYTAWIAAQDLEPARGFWRRLPSPDGAASRPGRPAGPTGMTGIGRARLSLDPVDTARLVHWAGIWGTAESSVLQAVWAMLLYRACDVKGPAPVCFAVTVSGRGIPLDGAARMPGPLRNPLPMTVEVDPADSVPRLLRQLRDRALDMAAYEWVPAEWIRDWVGGAGADPVDPADTVLVFEDPPHPVEGLADELAAHGIQAEFPGTLPARSVLPIGLLAHHDRSGALVLTGVHDRALLGEEAAAELLAQCALLLCELPLTAGESTTVAEALALLEGTAVPHMAEAPEAGRAGRAAPLVTLRAAREEGAGTICLIPPPGAPVSCYDLVAHTYPGPQELLVLATGADGAEAARAALGTGRPLLLGGFSGAGVLACDLARRIAADGGRPPRVVLAGAAVDEWHRAQGLSRALAAACGQPS
ncbi:condensation domain-containing protein [Streptomyces sp. NBC_00365]|uniref:condensation domain-containing protein n=1 Tax=Streptomyces sp. NBC_00365 TaxID=2975726 RepID=UPI002252E4B7|nr:condensation domain-containing protein [Streptomyces sp. NBC_00365]MCX5096762.1 condensation domain-containing protein [Streptomyces sp. NBC_00365]